MLLLERREYLRMRDGNLVRLRGAHAPNQPYPLARAKGSASAVESADADLRSLKINENSNWTTRTLFEGAHGLVILGQLRVRRVTHIDAKNVGAGLKERCNALRCGRDGSQRHEDLGLASSAHCCHPSVGETV